MNPDYNSGARRIGRILSEATTLTISMPVDADELARMGRDAATDIIAQRFADEAERRMARVFDDFEGVA